MEKNILDYVVDSLNDDLARAFVGNNVSEDFLEMTVSTENKIIGSKYPQTEYIDLDKAHSLKFESLSNEVLEFKKIELHKSAKLTDCISTSAFSAYAFLLSEKAIAILKKFNLGTYKIYPATVFHKGEQFEYGVLHFVNDLHDKMNFSKSLFYVQFHA